MPLKLLTENKDFISCSKIKYLCLLLCFLHADVKAYVVCGLSGYKVGYPCKVCGSDCYSSDTTWSCFLVFFPKVQIYKTPFSLFL